MIDTTMISTTMICTTKIDTAMIGMIAKATWDLSAWIAEEMVAGASSNLLESDCE